MIDVDKLMEPVTADAPCGEDLEYDDAFTELQLVAQYKPEQRMGDAIIPAEEPVWRDVEKKASALFERTKDLRVAVQLIKALLHTDGYVGAAAGFALLRRLIEERWDCVHPQLDPDDDNDPMMRFNILGDLAEASTVLTWVKRIPLVSVRGIGSFGLREIAMASGEVAPREDETAPSMALIDGAFADASAEEIGPVAEATRSCVESIQAVENLLIGYAEGSVPPNLTPLREVFVLASTAVQERTAGGAAGEGEAFAQGEGAAEAAAGAGPVVGPKRLSGEISSREDVVKAIDKICKYYELNEPSSPIPMLLERCKRLVDKSFMDIIRDMAPDGVTQVEVIRGPVEEQEEGY